MNRLLQGDVGSGKTVVAIAAMLLAVESGSQAALDGADTDSGGATLRSFAQLARSARDLESRFAPGARQEDNAPLPLFARAESESLGSAGYQPAASGSLPDTTPSGISEPRYQHRRLRISNVLGQNTRLRLSTRNRRILSERRETSLPESIRRWDGRRYELFGACVMPDHVHLLIRTDGRTPERIGKFDFLFALQNIAQH